MIALTELLKTFGDLSLQHLWFPLFVWTIIAAPIVYFLRRSQSIPPVYQYHSRVALMLALPAGIAGSYLTGIIDQLSSSAEATTKIFVVQNPITVSVTSTPAIGFLDPMLWIGIAGTVIVAGAILGVIKMLADAVSLKKIGKNLTFTPLSQVVDLNISINDKRLKRITVAFSEQTNIPFTYGWFATKIVIPADLRDKSDKCAMAIQHELMHIKHRDFLLNGILTLVKELFWFHPLARYLHSSSKEYREITCDGEVLADNQFSRKRYAALLFELAEREYKNSQLVMSMAVNPSSLKKRIQIMTNQNISSASFRSSFLLTVVAASLVVLGISCSDISDNGITNTEVQQLQSQMQSQSNAQGQLFFLNGERLTDEERINKLSRIKSKYIKSIEIYKGEEAIKKYGAAAQNGAVNLYIWNDTIEKAFTDLKEKGGSVSALDHQNFFHAVEQMPELIGGLRALQNKINYPEMARRAGIEGRVTVRFIVNEQGQVEKPEVIRGIGGGCDREAIRVVKQAKFKPGTQKSQPVRVQFALPIHFKLPDNASSANNEKLEPDSGQEIKNF